jgi:hypothetical protein
VHLFTMTLSSPQMDYRYCATSLKIAGSVPDEAIGIFS